MHIRTNDTVVVLSGRDKGKQGKVMHVDPKGKKVLVEDVLVAKRHKKPRKQGEPGGIITKESPIYADKVMRVCPKCDKPTRPAHKINKNGDKVRVCKKCGAEIQ
ncbi:MAG: 50S ribosomal protein L24 [Oscillospiraceae bacterium]|nr:50S ribosomal protein L24 [Oscillospiraceae bacterium]